MSISGEVFKGAQDIIIGESKRTAKELYDSARNDSAGEFLGNVLMEQPAKVGLNILSISAGTAWRITKLLGGKALKTTGLLLSVMPIIPMPGGARTPAEIRRSFPSLRNLEVQSRANIEQIQFDTREQLSVAA